MSLSKSAAEHFASKPSDRYHLPEEITDWIRTNLPQDIPADLVASLLNVPAYVKGLEVWYMSDRGPSDDLVYTAKDEADLRSWLFVSLTQNIAFYMEMKQRRELKQEWLKYGGKYDSRKFWMEYHLQLIRPIASAETFRDLSERYEQALNNKEDGLRWKFYPGTGKFVVLR